MVTRLTRHYLRYDMGRYFMQMLSCCGLTVFHVLNCQSYKTVLMGVPNSRLTTIFLANSQLTTNWGVGPTKIKV